MKFYCIKGSPSGHLEIAKNRINCFLPWWLRKISVCTWLNQSRRVFAECCPVGLNGPCASLCVKQYQVPAIAEISVISSYRKQLVYSHGIMFSFQGLSCKTSTHFHTHSHDGLWGWIPSSSPPPSLQELQFLFIVSFKIWAFQIPLLLGISNYPPWGGYRSGTTYCNLAKD